MPVPITRSPVVRVNRLKPRIDKITWSLGQADVAAIDAKAASTPGLGKALSADVPATADGRGWSKAYESGWVLWRSDRGALAVHGAIGSRWNEFGGVKGLLGWPQTDETVTPAGSGRYSHFDGGSVYWSAGTGARAVHGAIRDCWESLGWEQGPLGLPTSDEQDVPGVPGARRNTFESGEIVWTPGAGAHVTRLFNVPANTPGSDIRIQNLGNGGQAVPAPQVSRHVIITASMDLTDDEFWADDEHSHVEGRDERWVDNWDPQGVMTLVGKAGGELRVELAATAQVRPDGSVRVQVAVDLFEGTSEESTDHDGHRDAHQIIPVDGIVQVPIRINNDDEGGDFADISLTISNSST